MLGFKVAIGARRLDQLDGVAASIRDKRGDVFAHALDVTDAKSVDRFFDAVGSEFAFMAPESVAAAVVPLWGYLTELGIIGPGNFAACFAYPHEREFGTDDVDVVEER